MVVYSHTVKCFHTDRATPPRLTAISADRAWQGVCSGSKSILSGRNMTLVHFASRNNLSLHQVDQINYWNIRLTGSIHQVAADLNSTGCSLNEERVVHVSLGVWQTEGGGWQSDPQWVWLLTGFLWEMEVTVTVKHSWTNETKLVQ